MPLPPGVVLRPSRLPATDDAVARVLTPDALAFVAELERRFGARRRELLAARTERQARLDAGERPDFPADTAGARDGDWQVAPTPDDLQRRRVEITGPTDRKMMINAFNSGADCFMADLEDATSPTWANVVDGQANLMDAVRRTLALETDGKSYQLKDATATLLVRPRGWHLDEAHLEVDGRATSASLFDFGLYFFHNARETLARGTGPYFYLPKLESHLEARLWNDVFVFAQERLGVPHGSVRATVLIETVLAAFEMEEILHELRDHAAGLNAGRWDYIFSIIKKFRGRADMLLPDRAQVTMTVPFMRAYTERLVQVCHRRGAHAMGGMAAFVPNRRDAAVTEAAVAKVREDKLREAGDGFDGTWVAHPDLVPVAMEVFAEQLGDRPNQKGRQRDDVDVRAGQLLDLSVPGGTVTRQGVRANVDVALQYLDAWLRGSGAVAIHNLMEDAATAEISRAQLWQWIRHAAPLADGGRVTRALYEETRAAELAALEAARGGAPSRLRDAARLLDELVLGESFAEFLTISAYRMLEGDGGPSAGGASRMLDREGPLGGARDGGNGGVGFTQQVADVERAWGSAHGGLRRDYSAVDVVRLRGSVRVEHTLARRGAERLRQLLAERPYVHTFGALTGAQAVQMVKAGLEAIYLSGWQVAADGNLAGQTYPDQSIYPVNSVPALVRRLNNALLRADQIDWSERAGNEGGDRHYLVPIVADAEAGFGGPIHAYELTKAMIEAGAAGVHFEDQLAAEKKCGHMGGKVLVPTQQHVRTLSAARLAADVLGVPTVIVARTDAMGATLITSDIDERDRPFTTGERTAEGYFVTRPSLDAAIARALAYAPYADLLWCETSTPDLGEARRFAEAVHAQFPGKMLAYNCSPSFNWRRNLDANTIATFQRELGAMGYRFQFITLAGWHLINLETFELARAYRDQGMPAYVAVQDREFAREADGYTATKHQREAGTGYFDLVLTTATAGQASTGAMHGSTEAEQFHGAHAMGDGGPHGADEKAHGDPLRALLTQTLGGSGAPRPSA
jgi:malate synthase A